MNSVGEKVLMPEEFCMSSLQQNWKGTDDEVVFGTVNWLVCDEHLGSISQAFVSGKEEPQEWERALWAVELVFLNILHIAQESCSSKKNTCKSKNTYKDKKRNVINSMVWISIF